MAIKKSDEAPFSVFIVNACLISITLFGGLCTLISIGMMGYLGSIHHMEMKIQSFLFLTMGVVVPLYLLVSLFKKNANVKKIMIIYSLMVLAGATVHQYSIFQDKMELSKEDYSRIEHMSAEKRNNLPEGYRPREATDYEIDEFIILLISLVIPISMLSILLYSQKFAEHITPKISKDFQDNMYMRKQVTDENNNI